MPQQRLPDTCRMNTRFCRQVFETAGNPPLQVWDDLPLHRTGPCQSAPGMFNPDSYWKRLLYEFNPFVKKHFEGIPCTMPIARTATSQGISSLSFTTIEVILPFFNIIEVTFELNLTSPRIQLSCCACLILLFLTHQNLYEALPCIKSLHAPGFVNSSKTILQRLSFILVVSFPSEKVPAPPSPNCTLVSGFKLAGRPIPVDNLRAFFNTFSPFENQRPIAVLGQNKPPNRPAGPEPITTGLF